VQRGFSLIEAIIATGLLVAAVVTLAQLAGMGVQIGLAARTRTTSTLLAGRKMEELRALTWESLRGDGRESVEYFDSQGTRVCEDSTTPCAAAMYVCRWSVAPATFNAAVLLVEVNVAFHGTLANSVGLITARARKR
jgi:Tfp pilus assembly protein PilV